MNSDIYFEAQQTTDILDVDSVTAQSLDANLIKVMPPDDKKLQQ